MTYFMVLRQRFPEEKVKSRKISVKTAGLRAENGPRDLSNTKYDG